MRTLFILLLTASMLSAAEPTREGGLSVHMLPDRVAEIDGQHGGFTVTDPATRRPGATYGQPKELLDYLSHLPASIQQNGIWAVLTNPTSYSEGEQAKLKALAKLCAEKKIPLYTCRAAELPKGWKHAE